MNALQSALTCGLTEFRIFEMAAFPGRIPTLRTRGLRVAWLRNALP